MRSALLLVSLSLLAIGCKKGDSESAKAKLGPFDVEQWREANAEGVLIKCYLLGKDSNNPVRVCGDGRASPDNQVFLIEAVTPAPGRYTENVGKPLPPGWYILRSLGSNKVDAWSVGRIGAWEWIGGGKALLAVSTDEEHNTHVRIIDPVGRADRTFDVPLTKSEEFVTVRAPDDAAILLVQKVGVELLILIRAPLTNPYIETLDVPDAKSLGAKRMWRRGIEQRSHGGIFRFDAVLASSVSWKGEDPSFEDGPLGPFDSIDERKKKKVKQ